MRPHRPLPQSRVSSHRPTVTCTPPPPPPPRSGFVNYDRSAKFSDADMAAVVAANQKMISVGTALGRAQMEPAAATLA